MALDLRTQNVTIDAGCIACGLCAALVPEVFSVPAGSTSQVLRDWRTWAQTAEGSEERLRGARDSCPVDVIRLAS